MKTFKHDLLPYPKLDRIDGEKRYYRTPEGNLYPSVTTVLSNTADKGFLKRWINRVGLEESEKIKGRSAVRGTAVHSMCEDFVLNRQIDFRKQMPFNIDLFKQIQRVLVKSVDNIRASEIMLYSDKLKIAGSVDLIADYKGRPAIVDFKTSLKEKREDWVLDYKLQTTLYAAMLHERFGLIHNDLAIIICIEEENDAQVFEDKASNWLSLAKERCKRFHEGETDDYQIRREVERSLCWGRHAR